MNDFWLNVSFSYEKSKFFISNIQFFSILNPHFRTYLESVTNMRHMTFLIFLYLPRPKFLRRIILQRKGGDRAGGSLRNFCNKSIQVNQKYHVFRNLLVMPQINYSRNSILSKHWHCDVGLLEICWVSRNP